jgi:hypothetical protein
MSSDGGAPSAREAVIKLIEASYDKHFVFMFGSPASGKTAVLGSLIQAMQRPEAKGTLFVHGTTEDNYFKDGLALWNHIREAFEERRFPKRTLHGRTIQVLLQYRPPYELPTLNLVFLEMAGEDLREVRITGQGDRDLPFHVGQFLRIPKLKLVFLLVTPWSDAAKDDATVDDFLSYVNSVASHLTENRFILLITKWDTKTGATPSDIDTFLRQAMPKTYNKLAHKRNVIQPFSIGTVVQMPPEAGGDIISSFDYKASQRLFARLYERCTGLSLRSFWEKVTDLLGGRSEK